MLDGLWLILSQIEQLIAQDQILVLFLLELNMKFSIRFLEVELGGTQLLAHFAQLHRFFSVAMKRLVSFDRMGHGFLAGQHVFFQLFVLHSQLAVEGRDDLRLVRRLLLGWGTTRPVQNCTKIISKLTKTYQCDPHGPNFITSR